MLKKLFKKSEGFTLIEILVVIGIIAVLATIVIVAINPARQFAQARNTQRTSNVNAILNAVGQNIADNKGELDCGALSTTPEVMSDADYDIYDCIVPDYMPAMVCDPSTGSDDCTDPLDYDTQYEISEDANGRITVSAPDAELGETISVTR